MNQRTTFIFTVFAAATILLPTLSFAEDSTASIIQPQKTSSGIEYVAGGVGEGREKAMEVIRKDYNLRLTFARAKSGEYLADVKVTIENANKDVIMDVVSPGPLLFAKLPNGKYKITAEFEGKRQAKNVSIRSNARGAVFYFAKS